ncbi:unnamed protein product, partial [marine sediment metagenome]
EGQRKVATVVVPIVSDFAIIPDEDKTPLGTYDRIVIRNLPEWEPAPVVSVSGQVKYPGSYSLEVKEERISSMARRVGGFKKEAYPEGATLFRRNFSRPFLYKHNGLDSLPCINLSMKK